MNAYLHLMMHFLNGTVSIGRDQGKKKITQGLRCPSSGPEVLNLEKILIYILMQCFSVS